MKLDMAKYPAQWERIDSINRKDRRFQCRVKRNEKSVQRLMPSLKEDGQRDPVILVEMPDGQRLVIDGDHRIEALVRNGETMVLACIIPLADLGPEPEKAGYEYSVIKNKAENTLNEQDIFSICGHYYDEGKSLHQIADKLDIDRKPVRWNILIYKAGQEVHDAAINGLLPIIKTAEFLDRDNVKADKRGGGGKLPHPPTGGSENNQKDTEISVGNINNSEGDAPPADAGITGGGKLPPPTQDNTDKLEIDPERRDKVVEALKSPNPKEALKKLFAENEAAAGSSAKPAEFKIVKSAKGIITIPATHFPEGSTIDDIRNAFNVACRKFEDELSQAEAEKAQKEADDKKKADEDRASQLQEAINASQARADALKKLGKDITAAEIEIGDLKAELKKLNSETRSAGRKSKGAASAAAELALSDSKGVKSKTAKQASQLQDKADHSAQSDVSLFEKEGQGRFKNHQQIPLNPPLPKGETSKPTPDQLEQQKKKAEAFAKGDWRVAIEGQPPMAQIFMIKGMITAATSLLAQPNLPEEQRAQKTQQLQELQAKLDELLNDNPILRQGFGGQLNADSILEGQTPEQLEAAIALWKQQQASSDAGAEKKASLQLWIDRAQARLNFLNSNPSNEPPKPADDKPSTDNPEDLNKDQNGVIQ